MTTTENEPLTAEARAAVDRLLVDDRTVFQRMVAIIDELPAIGKTQRNQQQNFMFRGHDDVMNALNPLLAKHGVIIVPDVLERVVGERVTGNNKTMYEVNLHVAFTFYGAAGDSFTASGWGEGTDMGDKSTSKAMTMAFKYVVAQTFALATAEVSDADAISPEETTRQAGPSGGNRPESRPRRERGEFDPGKDLLPGAIAVRGEEDAVHLQQVRGEYAAGTNWTEVDRTLAQAVFGQDAPPTPAQWGEWWKRLANAIVRAQDIAESTEFIETSVLEDAFAWAFKGAVVALGTAEPEAEPEA